MSRILIAEDEVRIVAFLEKGLRANGFTTTSVSDGMEAAEVAGWLVDIARAVAEAAKTVNPKEQETIEKIAALFRVTSS